MIVDRHGIPLAVSLTRGNRHDVTQLMPLVDAIPSIRGRRGRPRNRPRRLFADRGYDYDKYRNLLRGERDHTDDRPARVPHMVPVSARSAGSSNVPSPGCTTSSVCERVPRYELTCIEGCSNWHAASSV